MPIDSLQDRIRKKKNPSVLELAMPLEDMPPQFSKDAQGYGAFCRAILDGLKVVMPAVRFSFAAFALLGDGGLRELSETMQTAKNLGWYVLLDAPEIAGPMMAEITAAALLGKESKYPCDGLVISGYSGSDLIKPFLPYCRKEKKDLFVITRTANKSAPELQDLLTGSRLVHMVAADHVNRYGIDLEGKCGYTQVGILASASSGESLRVLRAKYPKLFILMDGFDYPNANAKNCSYGFDQLGHGAAACGAAAITCAWKQAQSDGSDWLSHSQAAAERMKKKLTRYVTIL